MCTECILLTHTHLTPLIPVITLNIPHIDFQQLDSQRCIFNASELPAKLQSIRHNWLQKKTEIMTTSL